MYIDILFLYVSLGHTGIGILDLINLDKMSEVKIVCEEEEMDKASEALSDILLTLKKYKLRIQDLILLYGNLGYSIGASIEGIDNTSGPTIEELQKRYYEKPTVGVALMLQSLLTTTWVDDVNKQKDEV